MKRILSILFIILILCPVVLAESAEELFAIVLETSPKAAELKQSRRNEFLDQVIGAMNGPNWGISIQSLELSAKDDFRSPIGITMPSVDVSYSTPDNKDNLSFDARLSIGGPVFNWDSEKGTYKTDGISYSLRAGLSKGFEFKSWDTTNYHEGQSDLMRNNSYKTSLLQLENAFLEDLIKVLQWSQDVRKLNSEALQLRAAYEDDIKKGKLVKDSPDATLRYAEVEMKSKEAEQKLNSGTDDFSEFKRSYGIDPVLVDSANEYDPKFVALEEGNSDVMSKYYDYLTVLQKIEEKTGRSSQFKIKASIEPKVVLTDTFDYKTTQLSGDIGATYSTGNLSVDMSLNTGYDFRADPGQRVTGPTMSIGFSWSNTPQVLSRSEMERLKLLYTKTVVPGKSSVDWDEYENTLRNLTNETLRKESLELEKLEYDALVAEKEWKTAYSEYLTKGNQLMNSIKDYKNKKEVFQIKYEADKKALEQVSELFDQRKATAAEVVKITDMVETDKIEIIIFNIRSHIISNEIEILQM